MTVGGEVVTVQNYKTKANGQDGVSQGVELYGQYTFDSGFGVQANYTYNDTNLASIVIDGQNIRSEEHTSELQSQSNLVCRLLLEKKKKKKKRTTCSI